MFNGDFVMDRGDLFVFFFVKAFDVNLANMYACCRAARLLYSKSDGMKRGFEFGRDKSNTI
jgi:hypothetical protein